MHPGMQMPVPATIRLSSGLLFGVAGLLLLNAVIELVFTNTGLSIYKDAYNGDTGSGFGSLLWATSALLIGAVVCILAILNRHGSDKSRITTLVLGGLFVVCGGAGNLSGSFHRPRRAAETVSAAVGQWVPAMYGLTMAILELLVLLATLTALVLLVLPPSTRFIHSRRKVEYILLPMPHPTGQTPLPPVPQPYGGPSATPLPPSPPARPQEPHSASIPMADPWGDDQYRPRHHGPQPPS
ncbi:hypothetical protein [Actinoplanes sp. NPDC049265]|uniref:hypothetical protein n=1 Tax=Actinoplanes sp. NPDC049265 TaxID=3363902 RepID=UPI0037163C84